jgi:tRNA(fMet)-specific endonuclease VapC
MPQCGSKSRPVRQSSCRRPWWANSIAAPYLAANPARPLAEIQNLLIAVVVLSPGLTTADHYGQIRAALAKAGTPIPENDIWIAAIAQEHQLPVAARDPHFDRVPGLQVLKW